MLLFERLWQRIFHDWGPLAVQNGVERRDAVLRASTRIGTLVDQESGQVELTVDNRQQQRCRIVAAAPLIDISTRREQRLSRLQFALAGREMQRREAAPAVD